MTSQQYEQFCRFFIAHQLGIPLREVTSPRVPTIQGGEKVGYEHQIDLYWETGNGIVRYVNIANAKWHDKGNVQLHDVLLVQKVKEKIAAHKALLITNTGFSSGAITAAADDGIGLLIVRPAFDYQSLGSTWPPLIHGRMAALASQGLASYSLEVIRKGAEQAFSVPQMLGEPVAVTHIGPAGKCSDVAQQREMAAPGGRAIRPTHGL